MSKAVQRSMNGVMKLAIRRHYKGICQYCGCRRANHIDHIVPISRNGNDDILNVTLACGSCNLRKRDTEFDPMFLSIAHARARDSAPRIQRMMNRIRERARRLRQTAKVGYVVHVGTDFEKVISEVRKSVILQPTHLVIAQQAIPIGEIRPTGSNNRWLAKAYGIDSPGDASKHLSKSSAEAWVRKMQTVVPLDQ